MTRNIRLAAMSLAVLSPAGAALAHHSFAMFDPAKVVTLQGRVKEFRWVNPHVALLLDVTAPGNGGGFRSLTLLDTGQVLQARLIDIEKSAASH